MKHFRALTLVDPEVGPFVGFVGVGELVCGFDPAGARTFAESLTRAADSVDLLIQSGPPYPESMIRS